MSNPPDFWHKILDQKIIGIKYLYINLIYFNLDWGLTCLTPLDEFLACLFSGGVRLNQLWYYFLLLKYYKINKVFIYSYN